MTHRENLFEEDIQDKLPTRIKKIGVFLPATYRGGTLKGLKNIVKMIKLGSQLNGETIDIVFSCRERAYDIINDFSDLINLGIKIHETKWKTISRESLNFIRNLKSFSMNLKESEYVIPTDGINNFCDCDVWILISDRTEAPLAPVIPYGVVVYDYVQRYVPELFNDFFEIAFLRTVRNASFVITTTPHTRDDVIQYAGVDASKAWYFPMDFAPPAISSSDSFGHPKDYFLWTTNAARHKNHRRALKALETYYKEKNGELDVLISGEHVGLFKILNHPDEYVKSIARSIQENAFLKNRCHIVGEVSEEQHAHNISQARFLWHPAIYDNGTYAVVEAAYLSVPSLSSDYPAMRYMNERFSINLAFSNPYNVHEMADKLKLLEQTADERKKALPTRDFLEKFTLKNYALKFWLNLKNVLPQERCGT